jgi:hypothetical protein
MRNNHYNYRPKKKRGMFVILAVLFVVLQIFITLQSSAIGAQLSKLEKDELQMIQNNRLLSEEMVLSSSLAATKEFAKENGYVNADIKFIKPDEIVAKLP